MRVSSKALAAAHAHPRRQVSLQQPCRSLDAMSAIDRAAIKISHVFFVTSELLMYLYSLRLIKICHVNIWEHAFVTNMYLKCICKTFHQIQQVYEMHI